MSIQKVLLASNGEDVDRAFVDSIGNYSAWNSSLSRSSGKWVVKEKEGVKVIYKWTDKALEWLESQ